MKRRYILTYIIAFFVISMFTECHCNKKMTTETPVKQKVIQQMASAPVVIYKTRKDYSRYVPVTMDAGKIRIVSYPDPTDVYFRGKLAYPTPLNGGYFLDNRGIGPNVAFLNYTYETYSQLKEVPTMEQLTNSILDKTPLLELWKCGKRADLKDEVKELNILIEKGFPGCNRLVTENKVILHP